MVDVSVFSALVATAVDKIKHASRRGWVKGIFYG